jgi:hypothetical protein
MKYFLNKEAVPGWKRRSRSTPRKATVREVKTMSAVCFDVKAYPIGILKEDR